VKFEPLLRRAAALGAAAMATGHYARNAFGVALHRGVDASKDQSYFLFSMGRDALRRTWFPLGGMSKDAVRARAAALGLPNALAPDSQELCFVPGGDHGVVVERRLAALGLPASALAPGPVVDVAGNVVGDHDGIHRVTIGQRRGFRTRGTDRRYVLRVIPESRTVVVGEADEASVAGFEVAELQRLSLSDADGEHRVHVQWRHRGTAEPATVTVKADRARVVFDAPVTAVAAGQAAVFYRGDEVLGGGWIGESPSPG
jgi:tRNA-specific 2-thiouridylase